MTRPTLKDLSPKAQQEVQQQLMKLGHGALHPYPSGAILPQRPVQPMRRVRRYNTQRVDARTLARFFERYDLPAPVAEYRFTPERRWRFDYAWIDQKIALEVEGGVWTGGRHTRGSGFVADIVKYNRATVLGWRVVRVLPLGLMTTATAEMLRAMIFPTR